MFMPGFFVPFIDSCCAGRRQGAGKAGGRFRAPQGLVKAPRRRPSAVHRIITYGPRGLYAENGFFIHSKGYKPIFFYLSYVMTASYLTLK